MRAGAGAAVGAAALGSALDAAAQQAGPPQPEKGASIRVLRPSKFVQGDETLWIENSKKFEAKTGVKVRVDFEGWEDLRPKSAVAANVGRGPDIVYGWYDDAHQYAEKLVDISDVANYIGRRYGGWYPICEKFGKHGKTGRWISMPIGAGGGKVCYRKSWVNQAGFQDVPQDTAGFLQLCRKLKEMNRPAGFALGNAVGDGNGWTHWVVWAHGGKMVDDRDNVVINSPETIAALEYAKQLYETFIPGTLSWLDPANNKAYLDGQISLTQNGISIYYAAKNSSDPVIKAIAEDTEHTNMPTGPIGRTTETNLVVPGMVFRYTKFPNACKAYLAYIMEREQYEPWSTASIGYWSQPLKAYESMGIWTVDRKHTPYRDVMSKQLWPSYSGSLGAQSAGVLADFIMVNMVAQAASGAKTPREAAAEAQKRAERYYKL
jgi:multiple sugar transport system substrate-binding protein